MQEKREFHTNIVGKVRNTKLPKRKALWPLFETISNSIHAIEEKGNLESGHIYIYIIRNGDAETLKGMNKIDIFPVQSFVVQDNGMGFNNNNFESFLTAESDYKIEKGAKGIGRFVTLKAFKEVHYKSSFKLEDDYFTREFKFKSIGNGIFDFDENVNSEKKSWTITELKNFKEEYQKYCPLTLDDIAEKIVEHFLIYFLQNKCPYITLIDQNGKELLLQNYYGSVFKGSIKESNFKILENDFHLYLLRVFNTRKTHQIHYCANNREVKHELLNNYISDLGRKIDDEDNNHFVYHSYITSPFFDEAVDSERIDFNLNESIDENEEGEEDSNEELSLKKIRNLAIEKIEVLLEPYLSKVREHKFENYQSHIYDSAPQYKTILKYHPETIKKLPPNLKGNKLDIELFKVQNTLESEIKELGEEVLNAKEDIKSSEEYQKKYSEYIEKFNDIGKSNLAKHIVHRKSVIELLDKFLGMEDNNFQTEETIHNLFFPIRSESDEISYDKQNLWLIDERLSYHNYLSSDKSFKSIKVSESNDLQRPDLLVFNDSFAFVNDDAPHHSFTIVEFKRPERVGYSSESSKKNPIDQVLQYIRTIRENKGIDRKGKIIDFVDNNTPFYAYIVLDFNQSLKQVLDDKDFKKTPDSMGYFKFHDKYNAYIEVISYPKLLKDAKMRNRILFDKLGLPTN
ncbi:hypothetical protein SAMN06265371_106201 [Lutibacter agarilyticus]|uniref:Histidine kinase-, DNA gyrase B-, and HSP90-like ATPase n=1 Tax=Lutibacter agarilyticus TaxID=1109740 RepID=A0A238XP88_9FLAO|nr:hypothetical protein [Lutibacter agarilyticus]SNR60520.1 hypothetical protein SAMN06265371_106201 [Lutibacter agarilyticus]